MHANSLDLMRRLLKQHVGPLTGKSVTDVGSYNRNDEGSYRPLIEAAGATYFGVDVEAGPNVDVVIPAEAPWNIPPADVVICGQTLEHVLRPWIVMGCIAAATKSGGTVIVIVPWMWRIHRYPVDCWRILPDGMEVLLADSGLTIAEVGTKEKDCYGVGVKP